MPGTVHGAFTWLSAIALLAACGSGDSAAPAPADLVLAKAPTASGDRQVGVAARPLPQDLRAQVTRDGQPVEGVTVYWSTLQGSMDPEVDVTDAEGISSSRWTTKYSYLEQEAFANLVPDTVYRVVGSLVPGMIMYTAIAAPDPDAPNAVRVLDDGGGRFEPASITVTVGDTVNWVWQVGSAAHNIVPDDGNAPGNSGPPTAYPKFLSFRFMIPGEYRYHCTVHGGPGGVGMSGSVTVLPAGPQE